MNFGSDPALLGQVSTDSWIEANSGDYIQLRSKTDAGSFAEELEVTVTETEIDHITYKEYEYEIQDDIELNSSVYTIAQYTPRHMRVIFYLLPIDGITYPPYIDHMPNPSYYWDNDGINKPTMPTCEYASSSSSEESEGTLLEDRLRNGSSFYTVDGEGYIKDVDTKYTTGTDNYYYQKVWIPHNLIELTVQTVTGSYDELTLDGTPISEGVAASVTGPGFKEIAVKNPSFGASTFVNTIPTSWIDPSWMLSYVPPGTATDFRTGRDIGWIVGDPDWASADDYFYWKESTIEAAKY